MKNKLLLIAIGIVLTAQTLMAQVPGSVAQTFGLSPGFGTSDINSINVQTDGKIIVAGLFSSYRNVLENAIIRLNPDGSKDSTFNNSLFWTPNFVVNSVIIQPDGKFVVGGDFYITHNGISYPNIIRLNIDGSVDNTLNIGTGFNNKVKSIALQSDGKILVGGDFTTFNSVSENRIIRLNSDGSRDNTFNSGIGFNNFVTSIALTNDNKITIGGSFTSYKGAARNRLIRLLNDGTEDSTFSIGMGFNNIVNVINIQFDGKIIVGGEFTSYNQITENKIIRLNSDGTKDLFFQAGTGFSGGSILAVEIQPDGKVIVGGQFLTFNGADVKKIIRLNVNGSADATFNIGSGFDGEVERIKIYSSGKIMVGGSFLSFNNFPASQLISINSFGDIDTTFQSNEGPLSGFDKLINTALIQPDGKYIIGGVFKSYKSITENKFIRLNTDGTKDISLNTGSGFNSSVIASCLQSDGKIVVGGSFTSYNGFTSNRIIRLNPDGSIDNSFNVGSGFNGGPQVIAIQLNGKIIIGGSFTNYNGLTANGVIRLNPDGSVDNSFNLGLGFLEQGFYTGTPYSIAIQSDGKILIGGVFGTYNGITEKCLIRLNPDGTKDTSFNIGVGFNFGILTVVLQNDGKILVGGAFTTYKGLSENYIIRLNTDGSKDTSFITGSGFSYNVNSITLLSNGKILVGGSFQHYNNIYNVNGIIMLNTNGSRDNSFLTGTGIYYNSSIVRPDGKILLAGGFNFYNNVQSASLILLNGYPTLSNNSYFDKDKITVFPNPASTQININFNNITDLNGGTLKVINSLGQEVATTPITTSGTQSIMQLATWGGSGMYYVQIINPQGIVVDVKKIVLQ